MPAAADGERSSLIIVVPEAEPVVGAHRARHDAAARVGVPAHITVLYPFVAPADLDDATLDRVREVAAGAAPFSLDLTSTAWFGQEVLYLAAQDPAPLVGLSAAAVSAFPCHPPYEGRFDEVVPHLTVAHDRPLPLLHSIESEVIAGLPLHVTVTTLELWCGPKPSTGTGRWRRVRTFPLSGAP